MPARLENFISNRIVLFISVAIISLYMSSDQPAIMLGKLYPVVEQFAVADIVPYEINKDEVVSVQLIGTVNKIRPCDFVDMRWYIETDGMQGTVESRFLDEAQGRPVGEQKFKGIIVGVSLDSLPDTYAEVEHLCFGFRTISDFYGEDK